MSRLPQKLSKISKRLRRRTGRWGLRTLISLTVLCFASSIVSAADPVFTKNHKFRIPFQFDQEEMQRIGAMEIELHVSTDQGQTWSKTSTADPKDGRFTYEASRNGEFWFSVRTIDQRGQPHPSGKLQAGLKVVVDDIPPLFELRVRETTPRKVQLSWQVDDDNLDLDTLSLEFREPGSDQWQRVQVRAVPQGQTAWSVAGQGLVEVRGSIKDRSGNSVSAEDAIRVGGGGPNKEMGEAGRRPRSRATLPPLPRF
jgi:hypothetical protein